MVLVEQEPLVLAARQTACVPRGSRRAQRARRRSLLSLLRNIDSLSAARCYVATISNVKGVRDKGQAGVRTNVSAHVTCRRARA